MKPTAAKTHTRSALSVAAQNEGKAEHKGDSLEEFFSGWLDSMAPELAPRPSSRRVNPKPHYVGRPISSKEMVRVNRATVRESTGQRHWPPEVVAQFLAAEVISRREKRR